LLGVAINPEDNQEPDEHQATQKSLCSD